MSQPAREFVLIALLLCKWRKNFEEFGKEGFAGKVNLRTSEKKIHKMYRKSNDAKLYEIY